MNIDDIITLDDNLEYLILDIVEFNQEKYLYCVGMDEDEKPNNDYIYLKNIEENGEIFVEDVHDENILKALTAMFTANYINSNIDEEQDV